MAFTYPYSTAFFMDQLGVEAVEWDIVRYDEYDSQGTGHDMQSELADPKWTAQLTLRPHQNAQARIIAAKARKLDGGALNFMVYDPSNPYPAADPKGVALTLNSAILVGGASASYQFNVPSYALEGNVVTVGTVVTCVRAGVGYAVDSSGVWTSFAANLPRITDLGLLIEPAATNLLRNNSMVGAVVGTQGTVPTNWATGSSAGLTRQVVAIGTENGLPYIDVRYFGTTTSAGPVTLALDTTTGVPTVQGQSLVFSVSAKIIDATLPPSAYGLRMSERDAGAALLARDFSTYLNAMTGTLQRFSQVLTITSVGTVFVQPFLRFTVANATPFDFTVRYAAPQIEVGTVASAPILTTNAAVTRPADAVSLKLPNGTHSAVVTFDDNSTLPLTGLAAAYAVPTNLARRLIKSFVATKTAMLPAVAANVQVASIGSNNQSLAMKGLPAGYVITTGDHGQINFGTDGVFFFEFSEDATASAFGVTAAVEIYPHVPPGVVADQVIILAKPACKMSITPGGFKPGRVQGIITGGMTINALEQV